MAVVQAIIQCLFLRQKFCNILPVMCLYSNIKLMCIGRSTDGVYAIYMLLGPGIYIGFIPLIVLSTQHPQKNSTQMCCKFNNFQQKSRISQISNNNKMAPTTTISYRLGMGYTLSYIWYCILGIISSKNSILFYHILPDCMYKLVLDAITLVRIGLNWLYQHQFNGLNIQGTVFKVSGVLKMLGFSQSQM